MRQRGVGNARFAAAFFSPSRASARRESAERETCESRQLSSTSRAHPRDAKARSGKHAIRGGFLQPLARVRETRKRGVGNARFAAHSSTPRARPRDAKAQSGQRAIRSGFFQSLARICETRKRGAGNARFAAAFFSPSRASARRASAEWTTRDSRRLFFSPSRASARRESAERATRDSRQLSSAPRARPRDAPARSGQRAIRGGFLQPLVRVRETRKRGAGNAQFAALSFSPSRASGRRESAERATRDSP